MKNTFEEIKAQDKEFIMNTYGRFDVAFVGGKGSTLYDEKGASYIDFGSGIGTSALGANDEKWREAVSKQANTLAHISNLYYNPVTSELAEKLCKITGMKNVFFGNSGAEANECAIKIARKYSFEKYGAESGRNKILTLKNSFHGRTVTTLSATGQDVFHNYFFPFTEGFIFEEANEKALDILGSRAIPASEEDWDAEYDDYILAVRTVSGIDEAIDFINAHSTQHSEAIMTKNYFKAQHFLNAVDAAAVYVNASTRFTDGGEFGLGCEMGISTQKLHARGPMGLRELTTYKYVITGNGHIR